VPAAAAKRGARGGGVLKSETATRTLSVKAIQKKMARYAKAAGTVARCHTVRPTFAFNSLEQGAEIVSIRALLGHTSITFSARDARCRISTSNRCMYGP
jgi:site-specific recombinase XerD